MEEMTDLKVLVKEPAESFSIRYAQSRNDSFV